MTSQLGSSLRSEMQSAIAQMESKVDTAVEADGRVGAGPRKDRDRSLDSLGQRVSSMLSSRVAEEELIGCE